MPIRGVSVGNADGFSGAGAQTALEFQPDDHPEAEMLCACPWGGSTGQHRVDRLCDLHGGNVLREIKELAKRHRVYPFLKRCGQSTRRLHI